MAATPHYVESQLIQVAFVLQLIDGVTGLPALMGHVTVDVANEEAGAQKPRSSQFLFFRLGPGNHTLNVRSSDQTPYYQPVNIPVTLPMATALWPAYPDRSLADLTIPLEDSAQPLAYRQQRARATLMPSVAYPFGAGATLARGTVRLAGLPLAGAKVSRMGSAQVYVTGGDGQYVLFFDSVSGVSEPATLQSAFAPFADQTANVTLQRGITLSQDFTMV